MLKRVCQQGQSTAAYIIGAARRIGWVPTESPVLPPIRHGTSNMASLPPVIVHVEKPTGIYFSECFAEMRLWLAARSITPVDFHLTGGYSSIGLDIAFSNSEDADLFEREFSPAVVALRGC